jgi:hypothetical protein
MAQDEVSFYVKTNKRQNILMRPEGKPKFLEMLKCTLVEEGLHTL